MQYVVLYFEHNILDIIPYYKALDRIKALLAENESGEYLEDDMAIDGGDCETIFRGPDAAVLYKTIVPVLTELRFMSKASVTFIYGDQPYALRKSFTFTSDLP